MTSNTYSEEEFKQVLKNLFVEKKRVKELQKQLEEKGIQKKFHTKLADIHRLSFAEEFAKLKHSYLEKEKEIEHLRGQLDKVRPALKKLVDDLKSANAEIALLKEQPSQEENFHKIIEEQVQQRERENVEKIASLQQQIIQKNALSNEGELAHVKAHQEREAERFESERGHLVERLTEALGQIQRQSEMIKDLREEILANDKEMRVEIRGGDLTAAQEEVLEKCYVKMREFSDRHSSLTQERDLLHAEIRKAQQHLAKKVKEATLLRDLVERQKVQLIELQKMRKTYDRMTETFSSLKNIFGNSFDPPQIADPQNSGD